MKKFLLLFLLALPVFAADPGYPTHPQPIVTLDTTKIIALKMGEGTTTTAPTYAIQYADVAETAVYPANAYGSFTTSYASAVSIAPTGFYGRDIDSIILCNIDTVAHTFFVNVAPTGTPATITAGLYAGVSVAAGATVTLTASGSVGSVPLVLPLTVPNGGTGDTSLTSGAYLIGAGTGNVTLVGPGTTGQIAISNGSVPAMSTMSGDATIVSGGALTLAASNTHQTSIANLATVGTITSGTWNGTIITPTFGGTGANNATPAAGKFLRSNGTNFLTSSSTIPDTYTSGDLLYASTTNTIGQLAIGNTGKALVVSSGLPAWGNVVQFPAAKSSAYPIVNTDNMSVIRVTGTTTITLPQGNASGIGAGFTVWIQNVDTTGTPLVTTIKTNSTNTDTVNGVDYNANPITLTKKYAMIGFVCNGGNPADWAVIDCSGEYVSSTIASASAVSLTSTVSADITTITCPPGEWEISASAVLNLNGQTFSSGTASINTSLAGGTQGDNAGNWFPPTINYDAYVYPRWRQVFATSQTIHLVAGASFVGAGNMKAYGKIEARRMR